MAIDAAVRGMGIALESTLMMQDELTSGRLVCPVANPPDLRITTQWIVCPRDHLRQTKVRSSWNGCARSAMPGRRYRDRAKTRSDRCPVPSVLRPGTRMNRLRAKSSTGLTPRLGARRQWR